MLAPLELPNGMAETDIITLPAAYTSDKLTMVLSTRTKDFHVIRVISITIWTNPYFPKQLSEMMAPPTGVR